MTIDAESLRRLIAADEGQYFDRKSLFDGPPGAKKQRDRRAVRDEVAEYVAGFANADGGTLVLGVEDDGTATGCPYADEGAVQALLDVPRLRLRPPLRAGYVVELDGHRLLVFEVAAAPQAVMVEGNGFPVREGDALHRGGSEEFINQRKSDGLLGSPEAGRRLAPVRRTPQRAGGMSEMSDRSTFFHYFSGLRLRNWRQEMRGPAPRWEGTVRWP